MAARIKLARTVLVIALRTASMLATGATASAETLEERQACIGDAFHFCFSAIPVRDQVFSCLVENGGLIAAACRSVIVPDVTVDQASSQKQLPRN